MKTETITEARVRVLINDSFHTRDEEGTLNGPVLRFSEMSRDQIEAEMNKGGANVMTTRMFDELAPSTFSNDLFLDGGVFEVAVLQGQTDEQVCDLMFTTFGNNAGGNKPEGYAGRSMSVGDVVIVNLTAYACKDFGWEVITDKLSNSNIA